MIDPLSLESAAILRIPPTRPDLLFGKLDLESTYRALVRKWHPDRNKTPGALEVLTHINVLRQSINIFRANGEIPGTVLVKGLRKSLRFHYKFEKSTDSGHFYTSRKNFVYKFEAKDSDLVKRAMSVIQNFSFPDHMKSYATKVAPEYKTTSVIHGPDNSYLMMPRPGSFIRLSDLPTPLDPRHVAWIISRALNLACWLEFANTRHYGITVDNFFVEPESHVGALFGGWEYSSHGKDVPLAAANSTMSLLPNIRTLEPGFIHSSQIKAMGRRLLGVKSMIELRHRKDVPQSMKTWFCTPGAKNAIQEYRDWHDCLEKSFGKRKFVELKVRDPYA